MAIESVKHEDMLEQEEIEQHDANATVVFGIGSESFALPLEDIAEIYKFDEITTLPMSPAFLTGVINIHGNLASVISLKDVLNVESTTESGLLILLVQEKGGYALLVDETSGFASYTMLEEVAIVTAGLDGKVVFLEGVFRVANRLVSLINPDKLRIWIDGEFAKGDN